MKPVVYMPEVVELSDKIQSSGADSLSLRQVAELMGNVIDARDSHTHNHSQQVAVISYLLSLAIGFKPKHADLFHIAGLLHDIGKIGIPDTVLMKNGELSEKEWSILKKHPEIGVEIIMPLKALYAKNGLTEIILYHHERFDGRGYPHGLRGKNIPIGARIAAVADALSTSMQGRHHRESKTLETSIEEIKRSSGSHFDPSIIDALLEIQNDIKSWLNGI